MTIQELRQLPPKKLTSLLMEKRKELAVTRFHVQTGQEKNVAKIAKQRKTIAHIKTIMQNRELNIETTQ